MSAAEELLQPTEEGISIHPRLAGWRNVCFALMENFDGLNKVIEHEDEFVKPTVEKALEKALQAQKGKETPALRAQISDLSLFYWRVATRGETWNPLKEPLHAFEARCTDDIRFWQEWRPHPEPEQISYWLDKWLR